MPNLEKKKVYVVYFTHLQFELYMYTVIPSAKLSFSYFWKLGKNNNSK